MENNSNTGAVAALALAGLLVAPTAVSHIRTWRAAESPVDTETAGGIFALQSAFKRGCKANIEGGASDDALQKAALTRKGKLGKVNGCFDASRWICADVNKGWIAEPKAGWDVVTAVHCEGREGPDQWELEGNTIDNAHFEGVMFGNETM